MASDYDDKAAQLRVIFEIDPDLGALVIRLDSALGRKLAEPVLQGLLVWEADALTQDERETLLAMLEMVTGERELGAVQLEGVST